MKVGILTLGCRVNQYESDAISEALEKRGCEIGDFDSDCDLYIINTCTVTAESDSKSRKAVRRALRTAEKNGGKVAVIGCFVQGAREEYDELKNAHYISGNRDKSEIVNCLERLMSGERLDLRETLTGAEYENMSIDSRRYVKAYVKIEDGCNNFCSYCYVPFVRGRVRSRNQEDIINEIKRLTARGYKEVILTGIETSSYGEDFDTNEPLVTLVERIGREAPVSRLRFGSLHPSFFTEESLKRLKAVEGVMPHFHLSVQSASNKVLSDMRRPYGKAELYKAVENIRHFFPDANLSCDMICGFPWEREEDFQDSIDFIKKAEILHTHVFPYSKREGTKAAEMKEVPNAVKYERARIMQKTADEVHKLVFEKNIGKEYNMLLEFFKDGRALGYTENFINLSVPIPEGSEKGDVIKVKISRDMDKKFTNS
ncbi:MAG: tRNA (N(6)-L-threonylcarbamoyladenosine(37)-C(2))-methylthiotransferase MtaB [Clostridia bacterium]|nr:tRNA (N(6)-L-threonylcarbamoyladenosine(37)-C(2))-methylthiotransferase MtaB [Clostridia bacterium]